MEGLNLIRRPYSPNLRVNQPHQPVHTKDKIKAIRHTKEARKREAAKLEEETAKLNAAKGHGYTTPPPPHDSPNSPSKVDSISDFAKLKKRAVKAKKTRYMCNVLHIPVLANWRGR